MLQLVSVSPGAELAHRRFADYHWSTGLWPQAPPADGPALARVTPANWPGLLRELRRLGWQRRGKRLVCPAIAAVRSQAVRACVLASSKAKTAARARWNPPPEQPMLGALPKQCPSNAQAMQIQIQMQKKSNEVALQAATVTRSPEPREKSRPGDQDFRAQVGEVFELWKPGASQAELTNWGGWWLNRYRENPDKAQRVLAEIRAMIRERKIHGRPGAAAFDLWKRLP